MMEILDYKKITDSTQPLEDVGLNTSMGCQTGEYVYFVKDKNQLEEVLEYYKGFTGFAFSSFLIGRDRIGTSALI